MKYRSIRNKKELDKCNLYKELQIQMRKLFEQIYKHIFVKRKYNIQH